MDQTRLNPEHVRVTPEGARMMTLSRLNEILDAWESLTWPASRADAAAFRDRFGWTPGVKGQNVCLARRVAGVRFGLFECRLSGCSRCR